MVDNTQHILAKQASLFILFATILATITRPLIAQQSIVFTYLGIFNIFLAAAICLVIHRSRPRWFMGLMVVGVTLIEILPLMLISGGVNSQFAIILPMMPVMASLLANGKVAWYTFVLLLLLIIAMMKLDHYMPNYAFVFKM